MDVVSAVIVSGAETTFEKKPLSPEEKARLKEERFQQKKKLESCLTLVRALYSKEEVRLKQTVY